jgi:multicomponent Na+:H+ antiporter subunit D
MPWTFAALFIAGLSVIGIPGTAGFISKWYFVLAALERHSWIIALVVLSGSLLSVVYIWRIIEVMYLRPATAAAITIKEAPASLLVPMWILVLANIYFGINTDLTLGVANTSVSLLGISGHE